MGQIALTLPQSNLPNATEDPKIVSDFTLIQNVINGNIDPTNLSATGGIMRAAFRNGASSLVANPGDWIVASPSVTVTLPAPTANAMVAVTANGGVTGSTPVTVAGTNIYGLGLSAASSFKLGAPVATVILQSDGVNWIIVSGQQDTGWVAMSLVNGWVSWAGGYTLATRLVGDRVWLRGGLDGTSATNPTITTLAAAFRPSANAHLERFGMQVMVATSGVMTNGTGSQAGLDGNSYTLS